MKTQGSYLTRLRNYPCLSKHCFFQFLIICYPSPLAYALLLCKYLQAEIMKTTIKYNMTTTNKKFQQRSSPIQIIICINHRKVFSKIIAHMSQLVWILVSKKIWTILRVLNWYHCWLNNNIILDCGKDARENAEWYLEVWHDVLAGWQLRGMS